MKQWYVKIFQSNIGVKEKKDTASLFWYQNKTNVYKENIYQWCGGKWQIHELSI